MLDSLGELGEEILQHKPLQYLEHQVIKAPENKIPAGTMPHAGQEPDHKQVQNLAVYLTAVATQGDINIVAEEGSQTHMPAAPELCDGLGSNRLYCNALQMSESRFLF